MLLLLVLQSSFLWFFLSLSLSLALSPSLSLSLSLSLPPLSYPRGLASLAPLFLVRYVAVRHVTLSPWTQAHVILPSQHMGVFPSKSLALGQVNICYLTLARKRQTWLQDDSATATDPLLTIYWLWRKGRFFAGKVPYGAWNGSFLLNSTCFFFLGFL